MSSFAFVAEIPKIVLKALCVNILTYLGFLDVLERPMEQRFFEALLRSGRCFDATLASNNASVEELWMRNVHQIGELYADDAIHVKCLHSTGRSFCAIVFDSCIKFLVLECSVHCSY